MSKKKTAKKRAAATKPASPPPPPPPVKPKKKSPHRAVRDKPGRPTSLTPEMENQIINVLALHNTVRCACDLVGIAEGTFYNWMAKGELDRVSPYLEFYEAVKRAQAQSKVVLVSAISNDNSWQAKAWILERCHYKEFGRRQMLEHSTPDDAPAVKISAQVAPVQIVIAHPGDLWEDTDNMATNDREEGADAEVPGNGGAIAATLSMPGSTQDEV